MIMHGIKITGMPSWRHDYKEQDAWNMVAFLKQLPNISAQQYRQMVDQAKAAPKE